MEPLPGIPLNPSLCAATSAATITLWPPKRIMREIHPISKAQKNVFGRTVMSATSGGLGELERDIALSLGDDFRQDSGTGPEHKKISTAVGTIYHLDK